jgi:hypothetical protein
MYARNTKEETMLKEQTKHERLNVCGIEQFKHVHEIAYALAKARIEKKALVLPTVIGVKRAGQGGYALTMIDVASIDQAQRERVLWLQEGLCRSGHADIAAFVSEAWLVQMTVADGNQQNIRPSEHGARQECVVVSLVSNDCQMLAYHMIDRENVRLVKGSLDADITLGGKLARATTTRH